jgi:hypothetical protein
MLDRIDIHIEVPRVNYEKLSSDRLGESSAAIRTGVSRPPAPIGAFRWDKYHLQRRYARGRGAPVL